MKGASVQLTTVPSTRSSSDPSREIPRSVRLLRVVVLFAAGMLITFSAVLHEQLHFDRTVVATALVALALTYVIAALSATTVRPVALLQAAAAVAGAVGLFLTSETLGFALITAAWALVSGLIEFIAASLQLTRRSDAVLMGALGLLLALLILLVRDDPVAIIGFFGTYAVIGAVFLGISAFDRRDAATESVDIAPGADADTRTERA